MCQALEKEHLIPCHCPVVLEFHVQWEDRPDAHHYSIVM